MERGSLFDTPTFEWLDADETKVTTWRLSLQAAPPDAAERTGAQLCGLS